MGEQTYMIYLMLYIFCAFVFHEQNVFPTAQSWFLPSYMFRLPVIAVIRELYYYKDTNTIIIINIKDWNL
jgi:hypothetical protein